jgi:hypothetical protein
MAAAAPRVRRRVAVFHVEIFTALAAISLPQIDKARALFVPAFLTVHGSILTVLAL